MNQNEKQYRGQSRFEDGEEAATLESLSLVLVRLDVRVLQELMSYVTLEE